MENNEQNKTETHTAKVVEYANIDKDVIDILKHEEAILAVSDDIQIKRTILNCFCEMFSELKNLKKQFDSFMETISLCSQDKLVYFFKKVDDGFKKEKARAEFHNKLKQSHLKKSKTQSKTKK